MFSPRHKTYKVRDIKKLTMAGNCMINTARRAAELIRRYRSRSIDIISHMDADGISAAALLSKALDRLDIRHDVKFVRMLYREIVEELDPADLTIFTDLGSSQMENVRGKFLNHNVIIADHHEPNRVKGWPELVHLNAHNYGIDGVQEISGAGMAYLIARELANDGKDLSVLAVIGAIGDAQNAWGKFKGYNREIVKDATASGVLDKRADLILYGRYSRPIFKALEFFNDPPIPGVSNSPSGCVSLLKDLNIPLKGDRGWRRPADLTKQEKQRLASELISRAYMSVPKELVIYVPGLVIGESYTITKEDQPMLKDAGEFATCINATSRNEQPLVGLEVAKGDRGAYFRSMLNLLRYQRRSVAKGMEFIEGGGLQRGPRGYLQYFDATGFLKDTFVGAVTGLTLGQKDCDPYKPIAGLVREGGVAKVSARCSKLLYLKGLDMATAIREAAKVMGGEGGGHAVACGAQVTDGNVDGFLMKFEELLVKQVS